MPGGNGTGPVGQGRGGGFGRGNQSGAGIGGFCVCPGCGERVPHQRGIPCNTTKCPKCGATMVRG